MKKFPASQIEKKKFTEGDCWLLALSLEIVTGWPLAIVYDSQVVDESDGTHAWTHWGARTPDGQYLDIEGLWPEAEWLERWRDTPEDRVLVVTGARVNAEMHQALADGPVYNHDTSSVHAVATRLVAWYVQETIVTSPLQLDLHLG